MASLKEMFNDMAAEVTRREQLAAYVRYPQHKQIAPEYEFRRDDIDLLPIDTFLVTAEIGTGGYPARLLRVVKPKYPDRYAAINITSTGRLLYVCWSDGRALRQLHTWPTPTSRLTVRYVVLPGDPEFDMVDAFKILCDTRRACSDGPVKVPDTLLCRAIGWEPPATFGGSDLT